MAAEDAAAAQEELGRIRLLHPGATHHCWASRVGPEGEERSSDDGEPAGTAGKPILRVLRGAGLSDALLVVVRWFGGVKLGKGGLVRAYGEAARQVLATVRTVERFPADALVLDLPYALVGAVKRLVRPPEIELVDESYSERARMTLSVRRSLRPALEESLAELGLEPSPS